MSVVEKEHWLPNRDRMRVILISGASCPDTLVDEVMNKIANMASCLISPEEALKKLMSEHE
jgi:4-hydroxy-3-methylbut-2-enyl diphosphate reductase IspH